MRLPERVERPSLYVHAPFCASRCSYCDFHSGALAEGAAEEWLDTVERHLAGLSGRFGVEGFETVYLGGGTPSVLPVPTLARLLAGIAARSPRQPAEWTVEANPEDAGSAFLDALMDAGVTRLSVGVQSLEEEARAASRRRGSSRDCRAGLEAIAAHWRGRLSADFIYGLPGQTPAGLASDMDYLASLGFGHLSLYELTLSEEVPMAKAAASRALRLPGPAEREALYDAAAGRLEARGFARYEVSNWCLPGQECAHNLRYWDMADWLALGPSGSGNLRAGDGYLRMDNPPDDRGYRARVLENPAGAADESPIEGRTAAFETVMMALRCSRGLDLTGLEARFGPAAREAVMVASGRFPDAARPAGDRLVPTRYGMDTLNRLLIACMEELEKEGRR